MAAERSTKDELQKEVVEALPMLQADVLHKVMARLDELGVESPADMDLVREDDLSDVLKVVQRRRLLKHFLESPNTSSSGTPVACDRSAVGKTVQVSEALQTPVCNPVQSSSSMETSTSLSEAPQTSSKLPSDLKLVPQTNPAPSSLPEESVETNQLVTSRTPTESTSEAASPVLLLARLCSGETGKPFNHEQGGDKISQMQANVWNTDGRGAREFFNPDMDFCGDKFRKSLRSYSLRLDILPATIRQDLKRRVVLNKKKLTDLVRIVAEDVMETVDKPSLKDLRLVTRSLFNAFPDSLGTADFGINSSSTFILFYKKLVNRIYNEMRKRPKDNSFGIFAQGDDEGMSSDSFSGISDNSTIPSQGTDILRECLLQRSSEMDPGTSQIFSDLDGKRVTQEETNSNQGQQIMSIQSSVNPVIKTEDCVESPGSSSSVQSEAFAGKSEKSEMPPSLPHKLGGGDLRMSSDVRNLPLSMQALTRYDLGTKTSVDVAKRVPANFYLESMMRASGSGVSLEKSILGRYIAHDRVAALSSSPEHDNSTDSISSVSLLSTSSSRVTSTGDLFENYMLPLKHLPGILRQDLMEGRVLNKQNVTTLVRMIAEHVMRLVDRPSAEDMRLVTKSVFRQYPDSLRAAVCGNRGKPGYESFLRKLINRVSNEGRKKDEAAFGATNQSCSNTLSPKVLLQPETGLLDVQISEGNIFLLPENPLQLESTVKKETASVPELCSSEERDQMEQELNSGSDEDSASGSAQDASKDDKEWPHLNTVKPYKFPMKKIPGNLQHSLQNNVLLNPKDIRTLVRIVTDDLQVNGQRPKTRQMKVAARGIVNLYPRSFQVNEANFDIEKEYHNLFKRILNRINNIYRRSNLNNSVVREHFESQPFMRHPLATSSNEEDTCIQNSAVNSTSYTISSNSPDLYWCNYKLPFDELPPIVQYDLISSTPLVEAHRKELVRVIVNDILKTVPSPKRYELEKLAQSVVDTHPECFEMNSQNPYAIYETFTTELMRAANPNAPLYESNRVKVIAPNTNSPSSYTFSPEISRSGLLVLKNAMKRRSLDEGWSDPVAEEMESTFTLQRQDIEQGASVDDLIEDWPYLFHEEGFLLHLKLLLGCCLQSTLEKSLNEKGATLIQFLTKMGVQNAKTSENGNVDARMIVELVMEYFEEDASQLLCNSQDSVRTEGSSEKSSQPFILCDTSAANVDSVSVWLNGTAIIQDVPFVTALSIYFGSFFMFNLEYPSSLTLTLEFIQRCFMQIKSRNDEPLPKKIHEKLSLLLNGVGVLQ